MMKDLRCGVPSPLAWPAVARTFDEFVAVTDEEAAHAMRLLAPGVEAGPSGACGLAALVQMREGLGRDARALVINTEGATNPELYRRIVDSTA